jgi:hypothetical protein
MATSLLKHPITKAVQSSRQVSDLVVTGANKKPERLVKPSATIGAKR